MYENRRQEEGYGARALIVVTFTSTLTLLALMAGPRTTWAQGTSDRIPAPAAQTPQAPTASTASTASTTSTTSTEHGRFFVDVEPFLFATRGYGGAFGVSFGPEQRWTAAIGVFGADLPDGFRDAFFDGADGADDEDGEDGVDGSEGLDVRLVWGVGGDFRYRLTGDFSGWQAGVAVGAEQFRARTAAGLEDEGINGFVTPHLGYLWHPRGGRLFIYPRVSGILTIASDRERELDGTRYELRTFVPNFNFRVGFRF